MTKTQLLNKFQDVIKGTQSNLLGKYSDCKVIYEEEVSDIYSFFSGNNDHTSLLSYTNLMKSKGFNTFNNLTNTIVFFVCDKYVQRRFIHYLPMLLCMTNGNLLIPIDDAELKSNRIKFSLQYHTKCMEALSKALYSKNLPAYLRINLNKILNVGKMGIVSTKLGISQRVSVKPIYSTRRVKAVKFTDLLKYIKCVKHSIKDYALVLSQDIDYCNPQVFEIDYDDIKSTLPVDKLLVDCVRAQLFPNHEAIINLLKETHSMIINYRVVTDEHSFIYSSNMEILHLMFKILNFAFTKNKIKESYSQDYSIAQVNGVFYILENFYPDKEKEVIGIYKEAPVHCLPYALCLEDDDSLTYEGLSGAQSASIREALYLYSTIFLDYTEYPAFNIVSNILKREVNLFDIQMLNTNNMNVERYVKRFDTFNKDCNDVIRAVLDVMGAPNHVLKFNEERIEIII